MIKKIIIIFITFFFSPILCAWDATGHQLIAVIAYEHLTDQAKNEVDYYTGILDNKRYSSLSRFLRASVWADYIKGRDITAYNMWHYIDYPYSCDGTKTAPPQQQNVVWAIIQCEQILNSSKPNRFQKAEFLRFLIHFIGDIEQPLHSITLYSKQHPLGDHGGNLYEIEDNHAHNLHAFWDKGLGLYDHRLKASEIKDLAHKIETDYPPTFFNSQIDDKNPDHWAKESYQLAKDFVYGTKEGEKPSTEYLTTGRLYVEQRLALAGYRLANVLNTIFSSH